MASLDKLLRNSLVAEKICQVDRTEGKYIDSPYGSQPTTVVQAIVGTYATAAWTVADELLTVEEEFIVAEHVYDFEKVLQKFDIMANRMDEQAYSVAASIDGYVINRFCEDANGTYTTPVGGFTTGANIITIIANLQSKVAGYESAYNNTFLVIENTDLPGFIISAASTGFQQADKTLKNGFGGNVMGTEIYVVRSGVYVDTTYAGGSDTVTNVGHRLFGVKGIATYAAPRQVSYTEKAVAAKTGVETVTVGYIGFKLWETKYDLAVDITIA